MKLSHALLIAGTATFSLLSHAQQAMSSDPWDQAFELLSQPVSISNGRIGVSSGSDYIGSYQLGTRDRNTKVFRGSAYASTSASLTCDGVNLSSMYGNKMDQYPEVIEQLIQDVPTLAVIWIAYSNPLLKGALDELNQSFDSLLSLTGMTCGNIERDIKKRADQDPEAVASAECASDQGSFSLECYQQKQQLMVKAWDDQKGRWNSSVTHYVKSAKQLTSGTTLPNGNTEADLDCYDSHTFNPEKNVTEFILFTGRYECKKKAIFGDLLPVLSIKDAGNEGVPKLRSIIAKKSARTLYNELSESFSEKLKIILSVDHNSTVLKEEKNAKARQAYLDLTDILGRHTPSSVMSGLAQLSQHAKGRETGTDSKSANKAALFRQAVTTISKLWALEAITNETFELRSAIKRALSQIAEDDPAFSVAAIDRSLSLQLDSIDAGISAIKTSIETSRYTQQVSASMFESIGLQGDSQR